jgi:hypothetical protein
MKSAPLFVVHEGERYYLQSTGRYYQHGNTSLRERLLHRIIWISRRGRIPKGWDIHHKNKNWQDNRLSNLTIMPQPDHRRMHMIERLGDPHYYNIRQKQLVLAREKSKKWHSSKEGIKWHREHAKHSLRKTPKIPRKCIHCGHEWRTTYHRAKFCSRSCSSTYFVMHNMRKEKRVCQHCGSYFKVPYIRKTRFCSPQCVAWGVAKIKSDKKS